MMRSLKGGDMRSGKVETHAKSTPPAVPTADGTPGSERGGGSADSQREQTDESLRAERVSADLVAEEKRQAEDEIEDVPAVRTARREHADDVDRVADLPHHFGR